MKKSGRKKLWLILAIAVVIGIAAGGGIYLGGKAIQKQKEVQEELERQEEAKRLEEKKKKEEEKKIQQEEEERRRAEEEAKKLEEEKKQEEAKKQEELEKAEKEKEAENAVISPEENPEEPEPEPTTQPQPVGTNGHKIAIDAGHQGHGNSEQEPIGPGSSQTKAKVTSGTHGATSGLDEYQLNLTVALQLKQELVNRGYEVFMIRETHDVDISNSERAKMAADAGSDILVRIHANGLDDTSVQGALTMAPASDNPFLSQALISASQNLSQILVDQFCASTGANNMGVQYYNTMSGINWSTIPVTIIEMGFMTNPQEDARMATAEYQAKMVLGMANGIDAYFGN